MPVCEFDRTFTGSPAALVERARKAIQANDGELTGDASQGVFRVPSPIGDVLGNYRIEGQIVKFEVTKKPFLASCRQIETKVDEFIGPVSGPATGAVPAPTPTGVSGERVISLACNLFLFDHESWADPGLNETKTVLHNATGAVSPYLPLAQILNFAGTVGGEIRVEVYASAQLVGGGSVTIAVQLKLYEGASESSSDLDGEAAFSFIIPPGARVENKYRVDNTDEGADYAELTIVGTNLP